MNSYSGLLRENLFVIQAEMIVGVFLSAIKTISWDSALNL